MPKRKRSEKFSLLDTHPHLIPEWNEEVNGSMKNFTKGCNFKAEWICSKNSHHKWKAIINDRTGKQKNGCPICRNIIICPIDQCNSLFFSHPHLQPEWDETNNGSMKNYAPKSSKIATWVCSKLKHHTWTSTIVNRTRDNHRGCPFCNNTLICPVDQCNSLYYSHPQLSNEWCEEKNGSMKLYSICTQNDVYWICLANNHHIWKAKPSERVNNESTCSICINTTICSIDFCNSVYNTHPHLRSEWDNDLNDKMTNYTRGSGQIVNWICNKNNHHRWTAAIYSRANKNNGCPICNNSLICAIDACNSVYFSNPELRNSWIEEKNGSMKMFPPGTKTYVYWKCETVPHHIWKAIISNRTRARKTGCPICESKIICPVDACNSVYFTHSNLREEWDETLNGSMKLYTAGSRSVVSWICQKKHTWKVTLHSRTSSKTGCPSCYPTGHSKLQLQWLDVIKKSCDIQDITSVDREYKVGKFKVDGFCAATKTVYEFHGCYWHGCLECCNPTEVNATNKITFASLYQTTKEKEKFIIAQGYKLIVVWEHEWKLFIKCIILLQRKFRSKIAK